VRQDADQPPLFQAAQRLTDRRAAHPQPDAQVTLDQALSRLQFPGEDGILELLVRPQEIHSHPSPAEHAVYNLVFNMARRAQSRMMQMNHPREENRPPRDFHKTNPFWPPKD
jgi:hypothetical protein